MGPIGRIRSIPVVLILGFVTCGIYYLVWMVQISRELRDHMGRSDVKPWVDVLLSVVTCYLYTFYWDYKLAKLLTEENRRHGLRFDRDFPTIVLVLDLASVLSSSLTFIISSVMMQDKLNKHWEFHQRLAAGVPEPASSFDPKIAPEYPRSGAC